jgi:hypothetical protein
MDRRAERYPGVSVMSDPSINQESGLPLGPIDPPGKPASEPTITPGEPVEVVKTPWAAQVARATIAVLMLLSGLLGLVGASQAQFEHAFPNAKWVGATVFLCSLGARAIQEVLATFSIHAVTYTEGRP